MQTLWSVCGVTLPNLELAGKFFRNAISWFVLIPIRLCFRLNLRLRSLSAVPLRNTHMTSNSFYQFTFPPLPPITRRQNSCLLGFMQTWTRAYPNQEMTPSFVAKGKQWVGSVIYCRAFDSYCIYPDYQQVPPWLIFILPLFSGHSYTITVSETTLTASHDAFFICMSYFARPRLSLTFESGYLGIWVQLHARVWR